MKGVRTLLIGWVLVMGTLAAGVGFSSTAPSANASRPSVVRLVAVPASK